MLFAAGHSRQMDIGHFRQELGTAGPQYVGGTIRRRGRTGNLLDPIGLQDPFRIGVRRGHPPQGSRGSSRSTMHQSAKVGTADCGTLP